MSGRSLNAADAKQLPGSPAGVLVHRTAKEGQVICADCGIPTRHSPLCPDCRWWKEAPGLFQKLMGLKEQADG